MQLSEGGGVGTRTACRQALIRADDEDLHPLLGAALRVAARATSATTACLARSAEGDDPTEGVPIGIDGLALVLGAARPRELGLLDRAAALVRQAWVWSQVATAGGSPGGRLRRANFCGWIGDKMKATLERGNPLTLLLVELEQSDLIGQMYGGEDAAHQVPLVYNAVEHAVRGVDSVYRCDDATLAIALPRCHRDNAGKVVARLEQSLAQAAARHRSLIPFETRIRVYSHPGELAAFAAMVQDQDVRNQDPTSLVAVWAGLLAGAYDASVAIFAAQPDGQLRALTTLGSELASEPPVGAEAALASGSPQILTRSGDRESAPLWVPVWETSRPVGALLIEPASGSPSPAEAEIAQTVAAELAASLARLAPGEAGGDGISAAPPRYSFKYDEIIGDSPAMRAVFDLLERVITTEYPVILQGESGTGKELVARAIHFNGPRRDKPLIAENCAALNDNLLEAELFGYEKGSFTGAETSRKGLFELADGGTLFLDEVADMKSGMQKDLLRILQEGIIRPVGSKRFVRVDVRIICASNHDLAHLVETGQFRSDLFYRLNVWNLHLPPLRERREDIPALVDHFLARIAKQTESHQKRIGRGVIEAMQAYDWPGNVRELRNEIARMVAMSSGDEVLLRDFSKRPSGEVSRPSPSSESIVSLAELEKQHILRVLRHTNGNRARAADLLGINKATIYRKLKSYGLDGP